jgi:hypothetical protein
LGKLPIEDRELLPEAIVRMPVMEMVLAGVAVFVLDFYGSHVGGVDSFSAEITIVYRSDAHLLSGLSQRL